MAWTCVLLTHLTHGVRIALARFVRQHLFGDEFGAVGRGGLVVQNLGSLQAGAILLSMLQKQTLR